MYHQPPPLSLREPALPSSSASVVWNQGAGPQPRIWDLGDSRGSQQDLRLSAVFPGAGPSWGRVLQGLSRAFLMCLIDIRLKNETRISEFYLLGLSDDPELQPTLFGLFLSMYLITGLGNLLIILAFTTDPHVHTPMYFFLSIRSWSDICFTSTTVPKMLVDIQTHSRAISFAGCLTQISLFIIFCCMDVMLLTVMAYDRFVAICHPLNYLLFMNPRLCVSLALLSFFISFFDGHLNIWMALQMTDFKQLEIPNFFCDPSQILDLSCKDTRTNAIFKYVAATIYGFPPIFGILFSYYKIISSVLRIPSSGGKYKAFSTCGSHLSVVCLFFGTALGVYVGSAVSHSPRDSAVSSVMYTVVTPFLNPFIYSLRNRDLKSVLSRLLKP
ncbi:olfactory receptor 7E178-like [Thomomys bottae]